LLDHLLFCLTTEAVVLLFCSAITSSAVPATTLMFCPFASSDRNVYVQTSLQFLSITCWPATPAAVSLKQMCYAKAAASL
jgi:hypothetical protein